eukprot:symbB.v1.2.042784.t1/scaffold11050.1/size1398/1
MKQKTHRQNTLEARKEETAVTALQSQQQALEALALQQKSQSVAQQEFHSQLSEVEAKERKLEGLVQRQSEVVFPMEVFTNWGELHEDDRINV